MRAKKIEQVIHEAIADISHFDLEDESHKHAGRKGQESHFKILLVSPSFAGQSRVQRQRRINELLKEEFEQGLHALSMRLLTPEEHAKQTEAFQSPDCQGSGSTKN